MGQELTSGLKNGEGYHAAFIRDSDGNRVKAVTFVKADEDGHS